VNNSQLEKLLITDTIQAEPKRFLGSDKFGIIKIAELIGEAMRRTTDEHSVSSLFD
jgi:phosphoribosylpyrophosphate synthetase